ncbi:hypothetical protein MVEN_00694000 [Mycena venus]|uniref:Uncharacterized protein n=1 Tax=Mycena venus TaxID=2733690 RepID=A0A8H7D5I7_9AGAR|nr:hypothetical protein MVEN_00694000 [Mycena venus]
MSNDRVDSYKLDLGSTSADSSCPWPALQPPPIKRPVPCRPSRQTRDQRAPSEWKAGASLGYGASGLRIAFCINHQPCVLGAGPTSSAPSTLWPPASNGPALLRNPGLLALQHSALTHAVPPAPSPSSCPSPTASAALYAAYLSTPAVLLPSQQYPMSEEEDSTDALQTRRLMFRPFSSVVGVRAALGRLLRIAVRLLLARCWRGRASGRAITLGS